MNREKITQITYPSGRSVTVDNPEDPSWLQTGVVSIEEFDQTGPMGQCYPWYRVTRDDGVVQEVNSLHVRKVVRR